MPPPKCFETVRMSGTTPSYSKAHIVPSLARPVCASSRIEAARRAPSRPPRTAAEPARRRLDHAACAEQRLGDDRRQTRTRPGRRAARGSRRGRRSRIRGTCAERGSGSSTERASRSCPARPGRARRASPRRSPRAACRESPWKLTCGLATSKRPVAFFAIPSAASFASEPESAKKLFESGGGSVPASRSASAISWTL